MARTARRRASRACARALALTYALGASGCFVGVSGGAYATFGGNERAARFAPSFGVTAGFVYDAYVARVAAGAGADVLLTTVNTRTQGVVSGPGAVRLDLGTDWRRVRNPNFRVALGGSFGYGSRLYPTDDGASLVAVPYGVYHAYAMPSWLAFRGNPMRSMLALDVGIGPGVYWATNQQGLTDLFAVGGELHLTFSLPLTQAGMQTVGHTIANTRFNWPTVTDADIAAAQRMAAEGMARDAAERGDAQRRQLQQNNANYNYQYCASNYGSQNCGR